MLQFVLFNHMEFAMRNYDKLIDVIRAGQGTGALRLSFGTNPSAVVRVATMAAAPQDTA